MGQTVAHDYGIIANWSQMAIEVTAVTMRSPLDHIHRNRVENEQEDVYRRTGGGEVGE